MSSGVRVDITTDGSGARAGVQEVKGALTELNAAGQAVGAGGMTSLNTSATTVGKTFTRTGKLFKATGKVMKNSGLDALSAGSAFASVIPQASGLTTGLGAVTTGADALATTAGSLGAFALPAMGAAAIAAAAAYAFLHNDISAADEAMRHLDDEAQKVKAAHRDVAVAALKQREATRGLVQTELQLRGAHLDLWQASHNLAQVEKENGKNSVAYRVAALQQAQAEEALKNARRGAVDQAQAAIKTAKQRSEATDKEAAAVKAAKEEAHKYDLALATGFINGEKAVAVKKQIADADEAEAKASLKAEARHRANAREAKAAADALKGDTTPAVQALRAKLLEIAHTELNLANQQKEMRNTGKEAEDAAAKVGLLGAALNRIPRTVSVAIQVSGTVPGSRAPRNAQGGKNAAQEFTGAGKSQDSWPGAGRVPARDGGPGGGAVDRLSVIPGGTPLSPTDRAGLIIDARHRGDSLQEKVINRRVAANAAAAGITNPDEIALRQERAVDAARKKEIQRDMGTVRRAVNQTKTLIAGRKKKRAARYRQLRAVRGTTDAAKSKRDTILQAIATDNQAIQGRYDELNALIRQGADLQAQARELRFDIAGLDADIAATPDVLPPDDSGVSAGDSSDSGPAPDVGVSPDAQAQIAQANARALSANQNAAVTEAALRTLVGAPTIEGWSAGPGGAAPVVVQAGMVVRESDLIQYFTGLIDSQGAVRSSTFFVGA